MIVLDRSSLDDQNGVTLREGLAPAQSEKRAGKGRIITCRGKVHVHLVALHLQSVKQLRAVNECSYTLLGSLNWCLSLLSYPLTKMQVSKGHPPIRQEVLV